MNRAILLLVPLLYAAAALHAQTPPAPKQTPPPGVAIPDADRTELESDTARLRAELDALAAEFKEKPELLALLPDIEILHKAADWALRFNEFFDVKQVAVARAQLQLAFSRVKEIRSGGAAWPAATGLVVRAYRSRIDGSVQPYGLVIPEKWDLSDRQPRPLWIWLHGRNEKLSELAFIAERLKSKGEFAPESAMVLHVYGRYCNATKFAGETDVFEALADVQARYSIDPNRIVVAGFSMGGASAWHLAAHHAGLWAAASSGAGFAETAVYAKVFAPGKEPPPVWEQKLWALYDATQYAANLANCPTIAYAGELDPQRQASEIMEKAMAAEGLKLERFLGPKTEHKYEKETKQQILQRLEELTAKGREPMPPHVRFTTYTLRYNKMEWITIDALEQHWERADVDAQLVDEGGFRISTKNVAAFTITLPGAPAPLDKTQPPRLVIDEQELAGPPMRDRWTAHFRKRGAQWTLVSSPNAETPLAKQHGLTGPIDDAFFDSFIFVQPTGKPLNETVGNWARAELERAAPQWRAVFRGEPRLKEDTAVTDADIAGANLVLWGDPSSNAVLAKILPKLPITWDAQALTLAGQRYDAAHHAPVLIFPNPLNPRRYVVLNSSFTFRAGSAQTNSQQTPKLPDWAVIDLRTPPNLKAPGEVVHAGFFDEQWALAK